MTEVVTARPNGRVKQADILKLGDTTEERRPVEINGRRLSAWITTNGRYPASVAAELDDARNRWLAARAPIDPNAAIPSTLWEAAESLADVVDEGGEDYASVAAAARSLRDVVRDLQEEPERRTSEREWQRYLTNALCTLIPGLEEYEAEMLNPQTRLMVVTELGYLRPQATEETTEEEEAEQTDEGGGDPQSPPEVGASSTGDVLEPDSAASME